MKEENYFIINREDRVDFIRCNDDFVTAKNRIRDLTGPFALEDAIMRLGQVKFTLENELRTLKKNPVVPQVKWWSTMETMNADKLNRYHKEMDTVSKKLEGVHSLIRTIEFRAGEFPEHELKYDWLCYIIGFREKS